MKVLLINGAQEFAHSGGRLNATLHDIARGELAELGHEIQETNVVSGYDIETEVEKFLWADIVVYQMPGWWMGVPWTLKKYIDEVFTIGHGKLYASDGRSRQDPSRHYGSGGLLQGRQYMLSLTWNAPQEAFDEPGNFFGGQGVDAVYFPFHKSQEFVGFTGMPTFLATDVIKAPRVDATIAAYREHLRRHFASA